MGKSKGHIPIRTCLSCGRKAEKKGLVRFVLDERGCLARDGKKRLPGRGAYLCENRLCLEKIMEGGGFQRAFKGRKVLLMDPFA